MIPYDDIRAVFTESMASALEVRVINLNAGGKIPGGSFMTYSFSGFDDSAGFPVFYQENDRLIQRETVPFTVSFLSFADNHGVSVTNALRARDWIKTIGRDLLQELDVVVASIGSVENRDVQIDDEWERRMGFDIDFRTTDTTDQPLEWIEKVNLKRS
ncbi:phage neck terminator protein [Paenibacillus macerans]|uniref:phage neck terminator protein n=1 Tax=Paenibacillus macerans TaxID=44252 RepID=UPI003D31FE13